MATNKKEGVDNCALALVKVPRSGTELISKREGYSAGSWIGDYSASRSLSRLGSCFPRSGDFYHVYDMWFLLVFSKLPIHRNSFGCGLVNDNIIPAIYIHTYIHI